MRSSRHWTAAYAGTMTGGDGGGASAVRWTMADDRALEEVVMRTLMGLLFIGVKTYRQCFLVGLVMLYPSSAWILSH